MKDRFSFLQACFSKNLPVYVRHFKGSIYCAYGFVINSTSGQDDDAALVLYRDMNGVQHVRDAAEFLSETDTEKYPDAKQQYRFEFLYPTQQEIFS